MYAIYGNIYHQYTQMLAYIAYMDPMGNGWSFDYSKTYRSMIDLSISQYFLGDFPTNHWGPPTPVSAA